jgi:predicted DNA-binding transcriptional regulator YafY
MQTFLRRLEILNYLKSQHQAVGTESIYQHLSEAGYLDTEGSKLKSHYRLIQRDLGFLLGDQELETAEYDNAFGLITEKGISKSKHWRLDPYSRITYSFEKMPDYMALALSITQKHLKQVLPEDTQSVLKSIFQNAQQKLEKQEKSISPKHYQRLTQAVEFFQRGQQLQAAEFKLTHLNLIYNAILNNKRITLSYQSQGKTKEYELHPFGVAIMLPKLYLVAKKDDDMDKGDEAFRSFLIHKIEDLSISKLPNRVPESFVMKTYLEQGNMDVMIDYKDDQHYPLRLNIFCPSQSNLLLDLKENPISSDQAIEKISDNVWQLSASTRRTVQLRNWLLSLGPQAKIMSPDIIQKDLINHIDMIRAHYNT